MILLEKISNFELRNLVEIAYSGDTELLDKYWGDGFSFYEAVEENLRCINLVGKEVEEAGKRMDYYSVILDDEEIGYVCCFQNNLYSFSININYRTKTNLSELWERIKEIMGGSFICALFPQNTRAINWLKKCGMVEVDGIENNCTILLNTK